MNTVPNDNRNWNNIYCLSIFLLHSVAATQAIQLTSPSAYNNSSAVKLLCPGSSSFYWLTHVLYFMLIVRTIFPRVWPWDFRKHLVREHVCADSAAVTDWLDCCVYTDFTDLCAQQLRDLRHGGREGRWGWEDGWVTYHLMPPLLHNPYQRGQKVLKTA